MKEFSEAQKEIFRGFGMTGLEVELTEKIDPVQKRLLSDALAQLNNRTILSPKREQPIAVVREILPFYQKALINENLISVDRMKKLLKFDSKEKATAAFEAGDITKDQYLIQLQYLREMERRMALDESIQSAPETKGKFGRK
jgi:hypothetical protein